jgi:hypothetical protein
MLLLPASSWGRNYVAVSAWSHLGGYGRKGWPFIQIVAEEDDTEVSMRSNVTLVGGDDVPGAHAGQVQTWILGRGEALQITQPADTSGSPIETTKPVGLFGGSECTDIPSYAAWCDSTQQQIPPTSQWGSAYALVPYRPRFAAGLGPTTAREMVPWRLVGAADGTKLIYDPERPRDAPEVLEAGTVADFMTSAIVTVRSQDEYHPFYAAMFMTGSSFYDTLGDPDFVNVVPSDQFLDRYIFFVDHTYRDTTLTFVRRRTAAGYHPVMLDCVGEVTDWMPLGNSGQYEFAWLYIIQERTPLRFSEGICNYGRHEVRSDGPFAVYVWGLDSDVSYGYPGGQGSRPLSTVKGPPIR